MLAPELGRSSPALLTDLDHETLPGEGVVVEHDATDVSDNLAQAPKQDTAHETPATPSETQVGVGHADNAEQGEKSNVGRQRWAVLVDAPFDRAGVEVAGGVGAEGDDTWGGLVLRHIR